MILQVLSFFKSIGTAGGANAASPRTSRAALLGPRTGGATRGESGSAIVEFAMASVMLFTLIFGIMAICLALYTYNVVSEAAREVGRYAIVRGSKCNSFSDCPNVTQAQLQTYLQSIKWPGIDPNSLIIPTGGVVWPSGNENPGNPVQVTVTYQFPLNIPFVPKRTLSMSSTSQMVISQ
jgi:Flp pilus assembly protein TadG